VLETNLYGTWFMMQEAGVDVDQGLGNVQLLGQEPQGRRVRFRVVVAARRLGLGGGDRLVDRRQRILAEQELQPSKVEPPFSTSDCISEFP